MNLDISDWKEFKLSSICDVINGKGVTEEEIENYPGELYAIQGGASNNGCLGKISAEYCKNQRYKVITENCLTVARVGSAGVVNFQGFPCVVGDKAKALILKEHKTTAVYVFIATLLNQNVYKYSYGRGLVTETYMSEILKLPICKDKEGQPVIDNTYKYSEKGYIPDFDWMEKYIKTLNYQPLTTSNGGAKLKFSSLGVDKWKEFKIGSFFEIKRGKRLTEEDREKGNLEYYSASEFNNGLTDRISNPLFIEENALIYTTFGDCYYVPNKFTASDEISIWKYKGVDVYNALFIATIVNQNKYKYAYGRKAFKNKYEDEIIKLPICYESDGITPIKDRDCVYSTEGYVPDFDLMKKYILQLPYGDRL